MASKVHKLVLCLSFVLAGFVLALLFAELVVTAYYVAREEKYTSPGSRLAAERNAYVEVARAQTPTGGCNYGDSLIVHPYLEFVQTGLGPCGGDYANSKSLIGKEFPDRPLPRTGIILITGGSVAAQFTWDNRKQESPLERILNAEFTANSSTGSLSSTGGMAPGNNRTNISCSVFTRMCWRESSRWMASMNIT